MHPIPKLNAMLVCDNIITEAGSGKKSLIGIFENIGAGKFPCVHFSLSVYVKFTDAQGSYIFKLELMDLETDEVIGNVKTQELNLKNKLQSYDLPFTLRRLNFKHPGKYEFRIYANGSLFGQKLFSVQDVKKSPHKENSGEEKN